MYLFLHVWTSVTSPSKYSQFDAIHLLRHFFHCWKQFLNLLILMPFSASAIFCSPLPHWQNVSFWGLFFIQGNKKGHSGWDGVNRKGGAQGSCHFLVKNCWTLCAVWAGVLVNHPAWNGQMWWKSLQKNSLKPKAASHWYTDTDGFLGHPTGRGSLSYNGLPSRR